MIEVFTDGRAEPNPGLGTYGFVVYEDGRQIDSGRGVAGKEVTNNFAEYSCLVEALGRLAGRSSEAIVVFSDSKLLVHQMRGEWKVKRGNYTEKYIEARRLAERFTKLKFEWVPREGNAEADELTNVAYSEAVRRQGRGGW